ncbi:Esterase EstB [Gordonia insulae]|uniref:Esterase EstB n=1 Tax=Gordonia insulae TaxID=2420509 RepID=A0A3G8JQ76_9ACTN|nr:Esterase EstB [Gordonia insulae]
MTSAVHGLDRATFQRSADGILQSAVDAEQPVPGVVAMVTDRNGNVYEGAAGERRFGADVDITTDDAFAIFSTTKAITATAVLQLVEEGKLDLDKPANEYVPELGTLKLLEGFDGDGEPILRDPRAYPTTRQLLTHTGGFGYDFFDESYNRLAQEKGQPSVTTATRAALTTPLLFEPGERWQYGSNIDWAGQVVEQLRGKRLGEVFAEHIFAPLGIDDMTFALNDEFRTRLAEIHARGADGSLTPMDFELPSPPRWTSAATGSTGPWVST